MAGQDLYRDDPDVESMLAFQKGDDQAFETLFRKYSRPLVNFSYRLIGNRGRAEEIAQEVFLEVHRAKSTYLPQAKFSTWIYRISTHRCWNELRRPERRLMAMQHRDPTGDEGDRAAVEPVAAGPDALQHLEAKQLQDAVADAVSSLPEQQRTALILCRYHAMGYREAAEAMETTESAVKSLMHRATVGLRDRLKSFL
ncbi:MAG: sigma-70 family RNA polymerase sigma factor [Nitrospirae bacterium]|nr:sigma-70 family RNA polymerase sigma factor [Nitrospirota bacterium]